MCSLKNLANQRTLAIGSLFVEDKDSIFSSVKPHLFGPLYFYASTILTIVAIFRSFQSFPGNWTDKTGWTTKRKDNFKKATIGACLSLIGASVSMLLSCIFYSAVKGHRVGGAVIFWWVISPVILILSGVCWMFALRV